MQSEFVHQVRTVLLTGNALRHRYAATCLAQETDLVGILSEAKREAAPEVAQNDEADSRVIVTHLAGVREEERRFFAGSEWPNTEVREMPYGGVNSPDTFEWVRRLAPEVVVLFGTGIVRPPLLTEFEGRMVNVHLGLSPYYRGTATNFWPLVHREPECVGATIHLAVSRVDAGGILAQVRPEAESVDTAHTLGMKTIGGVWPVLPSVLSAYLGHRASPQMQDLSVGRVFRRDHFNAEAVRRMWRHFETGMMDEYVVDMAKRQASYPIVALPGA